MRDAKIDQKSFRTRFSTESRDRSPSKAAFFELRRLKMCPECCLGRLWTLLSGSWGALAALLGALGALLDRSWGLLGALGTLLGRSWGALGALLGAPGSPGTILARLLTPRGSILRPPGVDFRWSEDHFGSDNDDVDDGDSIRSLSYLRQWN